MADTLNTYSVLIAWSDNDWGQGEFGEIVRAANAEEAERKVRAAMREAHIANHCDPDDDEDAIAESCAEYEYELLDGVVQFGGRVIDLHEGAIWKAANLEKALRKIAAYGDMPPGAELDGASATQMIEIAKRAVASIDAL